jgi:hypothetical protein
VTQTAAKPKPETAPQPVAGELLLPQVPLVRVSHKRNAFACFRNADLFFFVRVLWACWLRSRVK